MSSAQDTNSLPWRPVPTTLVDSLREHADRIDEHLEYENTETGATYAMREAAKKLERLIWLVNGWPGRRGDKIREILL